MALVALAGLVVVAVQARELVAALYLNPDYASAPVIASAIGDAPHDRIVTLGNYPWYESLWMLRATEWLPGHRQVWQGLPFLISVATIGIVVRSCWRTFGPWAAAATAAALAVTSSGMRPVLFTLDAHGGAVTHAVVLGAVLVVAARRPALPTRQLVLGGAVLAAFTAAGATDRLLLVTGILPFALAPLLVWWLTGTGVYRRLAIAATGVAVASVAGGEALTALMHQQDVVPLPTFVLHFAGSGDAPVHLEVLLDALADLGGGRFFGEQVDAGGLIDAMTGSAVILAALVGSVAAIRWTRGLAEGRVGRDGGTPAARSQVLFVTFWLLAFALPALSFMLTSAPQEAGSSRYLVIVFFALAAVLPALAVAMPRARRVLVVGVLGFSIATLGRHVVEGAETFGGGPSGPDAAATAGWLRDQDLHVGYAGYQDAPVLTWASRGKLAVHPVYTNVGRTTQPLCRFPLHTISSWYTPRPATRTFIIAHAPAGYTQLAEPSPAFGRPVATKTFGRLAIYVYDHDVGSQLGTG
ncbi:MAG TPA: hypothetical protein VK501_13830 [Baekduia sp.]|nr:hypothetical protein [Baekduia sp.]